MARLVLAIFNEAKLAPEIIYARDDVGIKSLNSRKLVQSIKIFSVAQVLGQGSSKRSFQLF